MDSKKRELEYSYNIAVIIDHSTLAAHRLLSSLCWRVPVYPNLTIRRYFKDSLVEAGLARLTNWKPDALIIFFNDSSLLQKIRAALPRVPVVAMNALPLDHVDAIVKGSANELISLSLDHFSGNNITNFALFYAGPAEAGQIQKELFEKQLCDHPGKHSYFNSDIDIEEALDTPTDESMEQVGAWLQSLPKPVGIVSPTNHSATHLARVCKHVGLAIPGEIQLIGCDEPAESLESSPHLTTVQLPFDHIGSAALDMAIDLLRGKKPVSKIKIVDGGFLIPRESTGIVPSQLSDIPAAIAYIESHTSQGASVNDVLEQTQNVSRMTFYRDFKHVTGELPARYIRRKRIETACKLLSTTQLKMTQIAELSGFRDSSYFAEAFHRDIGMTPNQYRKSHKGNGAGA